MNKELELEANSYVGNKYLAQESEAIEDFMAGAKSKFVERQKLEFAITQLKLIDEDYCGGPEHNSFYDLVDLKNNKIKELEEELIKLNKDILSNKTS